MAVSSRVTIVSLACIFLLIALQGRFGDAGMPMEARKINVGGAENWHFGFNYSAWAMQTAPFYVGDTLVFMYKPTVINGMTVNHNVYLLHSRKAYENCRFSKSMMLANTSEGVPGFEFALKARSKPLYFACGIGDGFHCNEGLMKFYVVPR